MIRVLSYGSKKAYTIGEKFIAKQGSDDVTGGTEWTENAITYKEATTSTPVTATQTYYTYDNQQNYFSSNIYDMLVNNIDNVSGSNDKYFLATTYIHLDTTQLTYGIWGCTGNYSGRPLRHNRWESGGYTMTSGVLPVITLKTSIQTTGKSGNVWQLNTNTGTGTNTQQANRYLVDAVAVGDYVNYNANNNGTYTYTTHQHLTGSSTQSTFSSSDSMTWRVLSKNEQTGEVELIAANNLPQKLTLANSIGCINAEEVLNDIGKVYGHGFGAIGGRSVNMEDIEQYSSYNPQSYDGYGATITYTSGNYFLKITDTNHSCYGKITGGEDYVENGIEYKKATTSNPVKQVNTYYWYGDRKYFANADAYDLLFKDASNNSRIYWLANTMTWNSGSTGRNDNCNVSK